MFVGDKEKILGSFQGDQPRILNGQKSGVASQTPGREGNRWRGEALGLCARDPISVIEQKVPPDKFVRISRSVIVHIERVKELQPLFSGEHSLLLEDGTKLTVSRNYKDKLFELLGKPL